MEQELIPKYPKIQSLYKRGADHRLIAGDYSLEEFSYLAGNEWVATEKIDGTNVRVAVTRDSLLAGGEEIETAYRLDFFGRTKNSMMPPHLRERLVELFTAEKILAAVAGVLGEGPATHDVVLYGEGFGERIQKGGGLYVPGGVDFILFDVLVGRRWLPRVEVEAVAAALGVRRVPVVVSGPLCRLEEVAREGFWSPVAVKGRAAEGLVAMPRVPLFRNNGERIIVKLKTEDLCRTTC